MASFGSFGFPGLRNSTKDTKKVCGLCNADGKKKKANNFCKKCDAWICDECKKSHEKFRDLQKHIIVPRNDMTNYDSSAPSENTARVDHGSAIPTDDPSSKPCSETKPQNYGKNKDHKQTKPSE